ncbi:MAG: Cys-Gln thioester bond-forming surface protein, partial [Ruminiclostridium sp.]|nr:Cys-Gln thioester bond-forming surface protein [Ruminiclostridium sp.]
MRTKLKRLLAGFLAAVITASVLPLQALAAEFTAGQIVQTYIGDVYQGSDDGLFDDKLFHDTQSFNYLVYNADKSTDVAYRVQANHSKLYIKNGSDTQQVICIEAGVDYTANKNYKGYDESTDNYMERLPGTAQRLIKYAIFCGYNDKRSKMPISSASYFKFSNHTYNEDDFAFATQVLVWEFQQGLRTDTTRGSSTLKTNDAGTPPTVFYDQLKGRPAEDCYNYILTEMAKYDNKIPSFANEDEDKATTYKMVYNTTTKKYSVTLTDTKNTGVSASYFSLSGVTVTKSGNKYTFTTSNKIATAKTCFGEESVCAGEDNMLIWRVSNSDERKQTIATGIEDPTESYIKLITEDRADASVQKTFDNDSELTAAEKEELFSHISFTIKDKSSGKYITATGSAGSYTYSGTSTSATYYKPDTTGKFVVKNMPIDTYTLTEYSSAPDYTPTVKSKDFTTVAGQTKSVSFENKRDTGVLKIEKKWITNETIDMPTLAGLNGNVYFTVKDVATGKYVTATYDGTNSRWEYTGLTSNVADATQIKFVFAIQSSVEIINMPTGSYIITETVVAGTPAADYKITANDFSATVKKDETVTRTFTNKKAPVLVIRKKFSDETNLTEDELKAEYEKISIRVKCIGPYNPPAGYYMTVTGTNGKYTYNNLVASGGTVMKLDENGEIHLSFGTMQGLSFQVEEYYDGTDYTTDEPKTFTLISGSTEEIIELPDIEFENKLKPGKVEITKEFLNVEGNSETVTDEQLSEISFVIRNEDNKLLNFSGSNGMYSYTGVGTGTQLKLSDTYKLTADNLPSKKQYTIEEVNGTDGYSFTVDPVTFEITPDGTAQKVFYNKAQTGYLTIKKNSVDGKLSGWKFRVELVSSPFKSYTYDKTFTTDVNGVISIGDLRVGKYKVTEITSGATAGYITPESQIIEISDNQLTNVAMENIPFGHIKIQKVNKKTGEKVSGATFAIYDENGNIAKAFKSDTDKTLIDAVISESPAGSGIYVCNNLPITSESGTKYVIKETSAPEGYLIDGGSYTVTLDTADEVVPVSNNGTDQFEEDEYGYGQITKEWTAPVNPTSAEIIELEKNVYFTVKDVVTKEYLKVSGSNGSYTYAGTVGASVTDSAKFTLKNSKFVISKLPTGKYTVTEYNNAPGYSPKTQSATLTVQRNQTGTVAFINERDTGVGQVIKHWTAPVNPTAEEITELEKSVYFTVTDVDGNYLKISGNDGTYTYIGTQSTEAKFMLVNGKFEISDMPTGKYKVTEYNNAPGYSPKTQSVTIEVKKDETAKAEFTNDRDTGVGQVIKHWTAPVNPTAEEIAELEKSVYFTVTDVDGNYLKVSGNNGTYTYIGTQSTEAKFMLVNGEFEISDMPTGKYKVTEYNNAPGYSPATQSVTIEVKKDETATASFTNDRDTGTAQIIKKWTAPINPTAEEITELEKSVYFTVTDIDGNYLKVSGNNGAYTYIGTQTAEAKFMLVNGKFEISDMPTGKYKVTEYNNAPGY